MTPRRSTDDAPRVACLVVCGSRGPTVSPGPRRAHDGAIGHRAGVAALWVVVTGTREQAITDQASAATWFAGWNPVRSSCASCASAVSSSRADPARVQARGGLHRRRSGGERAAAAGPHQRAFDFFLERKRLADFRRSPTSTQYSTATGQKYFTPGYPATGSQTCYPIPRPERDNYLDVTR